MASQCRTRSMPRLFAPGGVVVMVTPAPVEVLAVLPCTVITLASVTLPAETSPTIAAVRPTPMDAEPPGQSGTSVQSKSGAPMRQELTILVTRPNFLDLSLLIPASRMQLEGLQLNGTRRHTMAHPRIGDAK